MLFLFHGYMDQSCFKLSDLCFNQLLSITHEIYSGCDNSYKVRGVFLDISISQY